MNDDNTGLEVLEKFAATTLRLRELLADTAEAQWQASRHPVAQEDVNIRSRGLYNDPTYQITVDTGRLKLRAAVIDAEKALALADQTMRVAVRKLTEARSRQDRPEPAA
ncbi:hypothetical protein MZK47_07265 [Microbacterium aerolatum]|uniref:DUF7169 domain-containing protein n=1 Tax=Microbacterium aerolatum TaxID=153731 RepID=UPI0020012134|nr:hypothetical protein [Microbacterium aerolatum]MCK3769463.1 hypothetical protein [Microbacterium aerolatum]